MYFHWWKSLNEEYMAIVHDHWQILPVKLCIKVRDTRRKSEDEGSATILKRCCSLSWKKLT